MLKLCSGDPSPEHKQPGHEADHYAWLRLSDIMDGSIPTSTLLS